MCLKCHSHTNSHDVCNYHIIVVRLSERRTRTQNNVYKIMLNAEKWNFNWAETKYIYVHNEMIRTRQELLPLSEMEVRRQTRFYASSLHSCDPWSWYINGLVQESRNYSALTMEIRLSCINPSIYALHRKIAKPITFSNFTTHITHSTWCVKFSTYIE